jgi:hypothetical protein
MKFSTVLAKSPAYENRLVHHSAIFVPPWMSLACACFEGRMEGSMPSPSIDSRPTAAQFALAILVLNSKPIKWSLEGAEDSCN